MKAVSVAAAVVLAVMFALSMVTLAPGAVPSAPHDWGTCVRGSLSSDASTTKYFINCSTAGGNETELTVFNPSATLSAGVGFFFITSSGTVTGPEVTVPPIASRRIVTSDYVAGSEFSTRIVATIPVVGERTTFGHYKAWATSSKGSTWPSTAWYFVSGSTAFGTETIVNILNPGGSAVTVDLDITTSTGSVAGPQDVNLPAGTRYLVDLGDYVTDNTAAARVTSTGAGVICEQTMFDNAGMWRNDSSGFNGVGGDSGTCFQYLAEGGNTGGVTSGVMILNPQSKAINVTLSLFTTAGLAAAPGFSLAPGERRVVLYSTYVSNTSVSATITSEGAVLCESMMTGNSSAWAHGLPASTEGATSVYFPANSTKDGREEMISLVNAGTADTGYRLTMYFDDGTSQIYTGALQTNHAAPFNMNTIAGDGKEFSLVVESTGGQPIVAEKSEYGDARLTITSSAGAGGSISPPGKVELPIGGSQAYAITPDEGYVVANVLVDGASVGAVENYTFTDVIDNHTIAASFEEDISPLATWYLAEGSTDWGFDCYVSIVNPNEEAVDVAVTYMTSSGEATGPTVHMPAQSQATVLPRETLGAADFSTRLLCEQGEAISVDRTMYWTGAYSEVPEAHCATGVTAPATTWYLPEGSSNWGFECFLLIQNPNTATANCKVTWMIQGGSALESEYAIAAGSRATFNMADAIGAADSSIKVESDIPVIPERAMYRNDRREGHGSTGTTTAAADFYLAEGCTGFGFTTWVLVQNPNDTEAEVAVAYQSAAGLVEGPTFTMPGRSRQSINVNETTVIPGDDPSFSTHVHGSQPIIAERAMYWNGGADSAEVCHGSIGLDAPHTSWYLADGQSSDGRETWVLVQNPNSSEITVGIHYMTPDGTGNVSKLETIPANSRRTFNMAEHAGIEGRAAISVVAKTPGMKIMCERAMYWNNRGTGTDTIGGYAD